jgi:heme-degrading monooxygenase HmoA
MQRWILVLVGAITLLVCGGRTLPLVQAKPAASGGAAGYAVIRRYQVKAGASAEIVRRARAGFVPIISATPGFRAWYLVDTGNDTLIAVSIFNDRAGAEASTKRAAEWIKKNLAELMPTPPEITSGALVIHKLK